MTNKSFLPLTGVREGTSYLRNSTPDIPELDDFVAFLTLRKPILSGRHARCSTGLADRVM